MAQENILETFSSGIYDVSTVQVTLVLYLTYVSVGLKVFARAHCAILTCYFGTFVNHLIFLYIAIDSSFESLCSYIWGVLCLHTDSLYKLLWQHLRKNYAFDLGFYFGKILKLVNSEPEKFRNNQKGLLLKHSQELTQNPLMKFCMHLLLLFSLLIL